MDPAMFSVANMFGSDSGDEEEEDDAAFVERDHTFPGLVLRIREFAFHQVNANLLWPGATVFAEWILDHKELVSGRRVLELGSGTGALAIFLKKTLRLDITTSDYDDAEIENNITKNCHLNGLATLPHIRHTWGEDFPYASPDWDLVIASDILLYVKQYPNLIQTLSHLLKDNEVVGSEQNGRAPEPFPTEIINDQRPVSSSDRSGAQSSDSPGASGAAAKSVLQGSDLTTESPTVGSNSRSEDPVSLGLPSSEPSCVDGSPPSPSRQAATMSSKGASLRRGSLPRPSFLMSWRRRIPKQDEALFFEGCMTAGLKGYCGKNAHRKCSQCSLNGTRQFSTKSPICPEIHLLHKCNSNKGVADTHK